VRSARWIKAAMRSVTIGHNGFGLVAPAKVFSIGLGSAEKDLWV
jgi:hypothetical protein